MGEFAPPAVVLEHDSMGIPWHLLEMCLSSSPCQDLLDQTLLYDKIPGDLVCVLKGEEHWFKANN